MVNLKTLQKEKKGLFFNGYCVALRVWTETEDQADAASYESACSLLNCSTNEEIKRGSICCSRNHKKPTLCLCMCV